MKQKHKYLFIESSLKHLPEYKVTFYNRLLIIVVLLEADIEGLFMNMELKAWIAQLENLTKAYVDL